MEKENRMFLNLQSRKVSKMQNDLQGLMCFISSVGVEHIESLKYISEIRDLISQCDYYLGTLLIKMFKLEEEEK